jgi:hypothetical protein
MDSRVRQAPRAHVLLLFAALLLVSLIQAGCAGVTSAKGNSIASTAATTSTNSTSTPAGALSASPSTLSFGSVPIGSTSNQSLTITDSGTAAVTISQVSSSVTGLTITGVALPVSLNPGDSVTFTASFAPQVAGNASGSVSFTSAQLSAAFTVPMTGVGAAVAPSVTSQPISQSILTGQTATFSVTASGTAPLSYQWKKNGAAITGATSASYTTPAETTSDSGAQFSAVVSNSAGTATSNNAVLTVTTNPIGPSITTQPSNQTIFANLTATFSVLANGTSPLSYQWRKNGVAIPGATSATYTTPAETTSDSGSLFSVVVSNSVGSINSNNATLTVNPDPVAPSITSQPASQTITAGQTATFSVTASGTAPLSYQWQKNGSAIGGATSASYTTPAETTADNGAQFSVVVSNSAGTATSNNAVLTVNAVAPSITAQPANRTITAGQTATFSVTASGTAPLSYQWQKNGSAIGGATSAGYTTPAETTADNGAQFSVVVSNSAGNATSNAATLTVNPAAPGALTPSTTSLTFSNVIIGGNQLQGITFTNSGSVNITVSTVTITGAGFTANGVSNGQIITPGQIVTLNVTYTPSGTASVPGNVTVTSNASNSPNSITLTGTGAFPHSATLSWTASTSTVVGYNVYRGTVSGGPYTLVNSSTVAGTQFTDSTVLAGQTYFFVVTAVASGNVQSVNSNEVSGTIPTP